MFYTSCDGVCPMLAFTMRRMEAALPVNQRARAQWLMVSFDAKRDTPQRLKDFAQLNQIIVRSGNSRGLRKRAFASWPPCSVFATANCRGGAFSHSSVILWPMNRE